MSCWPSLELNRACEWCSSPDFMRGEIEDYLHKPLDEWQELLLDLCYCYDCVQEYHRLADEAKQNNQCSAMFQEFLTLDIERLTRTIAGALQGSAEDILTKLQVPLMELLGYPYLLHHKQLADRFVDGIIAVLKCSYPLKLEEKLPGAYLLLIHPNEKVRVWATRSVRSLGLINPDDYDILVDVIEWMLGVVTFDISSNLIALEDIPRHKFLPCHLFVTPSFSEYWTGLVVLVMQMDVATVQSCLMSSDENGHRDFLVTIMSNLKDQMEEEGPFWSVLQCFAVFIEKLGERIWQMPSFHYQPNGVFDIITSNAVYTNYIQKRQAESEVNNNSQTASYGDSKRRLYKTALVWFRPFVESFLDFESGEFCVSEVLMYFHNLAECCSPQSTFKSEVQSLLLTMIHSLVCKKLSHLLGSTADLWAGDVLEIAKLGAEEKKRQLQYLLKICFRNEQKTALKYSDMFSRQTLPILSSSEEEEIVSILIQGFKSKGQKFIKLEENITQPSFPVTIMEAERENMQSLSTIVDEGSKSLLKPSDSGKTRAVGKTVNDERSSVHNMAIEKSGSSVTGEFDSEPRKRKIDPTVRSWGKAGPSTYVSSSEEDGDEEYFMKMKRRKKKHQRESSKVFDKPLGIITGPAITVRLVDYKQQGQTEKDLLHAHEGITGDRPVTDDTKIRAKDGANHQKPKVEQKKFFARKSTGRLGERTSKHHRKRDVEDNVANNLDCKDPLFKRTVKKERTESYFLDDDEDLDAALGEMMESFDSQQPKNVATKAEVQKTIFSSKEDVADDSSESSDGELFKSVFACKTESTSSVTSFERDIIFPEVKSEVPAPESAAVQGSASMNEKGETPSIQMDIDLYRERMQLEVMGDAHYSLDFEEDKGEVLGEEAEGPSALQVVPNALQSLSSLNIVHGDVSDRPALKEEGECFESNKNLKTAKAISEDSEPLSSISRRVENDALDNGIGDFWDDVNSELIMNSQENVLASIEDDLAGVYGTLPENVERESAMSSLEGCRGVGFKSVHQTDENKLSEAKDATHTSIKSVDFLSDSRPPDVATATAATRSSAHPLVPVAKTPAITTPQRALTEDEFFHEILSWKAVDLGNPDSRKKTSILPRRYPVLFMPDRSGFDSMDQYHDTFKPLLFMEIWAKAVNDWMEVNVDKKKVNVEVLDGSSSNKTFLIVCCGFINLDQRNKVLFPVEHDLVVMSFFSPELRGAEDTSVSGMPYPPVFGIVEKVEVTPTKRSERSNKGSSSEEDTVDSSAFQLKLHIKTTANFRPPRKSFLSVKFVTQLLTHLRQWVGLMNIAKSLLASDILKPRRADYFCLNDYKHSTTVSKEYNASQEKVISCGTNAMHLPYPIPRVCLVQGPPGTGKSYTIVGLIKEILNRRQEPAAQPTTESPVLANKFRILLCAPSNAAIDELIGQIKRARIRLDKKQDNKENRRRNQQSAFQKASLKNCGDVTLVRVGRKSQVHSSVSEFWLETMTKNKLQEKRSVSAGDVNINVYKDELNACTAELEALETRIWALQSNKNQETKEKIKDLQQKKDRLKNQRRLVQVKLRMERDKQNHLHREEARIRREILDSADIVCTTLSGAGSTSLKQDYGRCKCPFGCVIVDEACQATELDVLIPLEFKSTKLVLVGDPEQLPPTIISEKAKANAFGLSMFQRLYKFFRHNDLGRPVMMLEEQYRMHPEIASFPSRHFYSSRLKCHRSLETRPFSLKVHYAVFDIIRGQEVHLERGALCNPTEVRLVVELCRLLTEMLHSGSIGIITPYRKQKMDIQQRLSRDFSNIEVNTVDGFQGREKDVVILSCVRAKNNRAGIGFVGDKQRMNVALTRARHALFILGDMQTLKSGSHDWMELVEDAQKRECIFAVEAFEDMKSHLSSHNLRLSLSGTHTETTAVLTKGSHGPSVGSENESLQQLSIAIPSTGQVRKEIVASGSTTEGNSVSRSETPRSVLRKEKTSQQTPRGISKRRVTWADRSVRSSTDNGSASRAHATYEQVKQGDCRRHSASEIGKEYIDAVNRYSYGKRIDVRSHVGGSSDSIQNDDDLHRRVDEVSSKEPRSREQRTDPALERRSNSASNREQSKQEGAKHTCTSARSTVSETQETNEEDVAFKDEDDETGDYRFADQRGLKESIRHGRKTDLPEGDYNHYPPSREPRRHTKTDEDRLPSNPVSYEQEKDSKVSSTPCHGFDVCRNEHQEIVKESGGNEQRLGPIWELRGLQSSKQVLTGGESAKHHRIPECINLVEDDDSDVEGNQMDAQNLPSASESSVPSSDVNVIRGGTDCNGYDTGSVMDPQDDSLDSNNTQVYNEDPILNSVIKNNRSFSPAYFASLQKQEKASNLHSTSARISTTTSISLSSSPSNSVSNYALPSGNSTTISVSNTLHSSSYSRTSVSPLSSALPSTSTRSGNQQPPLSRVSLSRRDNSIQGELDPVVQGRANAVAQRHPRSRGPEIIQPYLCNHGMRNPLGSGRQRTARVTGKDVSSLRARGVGEERQHTEQRRPRRQRIDKRKVYENFRGRTNWNK